jgi:hypothetical protein
MNNNNMVQTNNTITGQVDSLSPTFLLLYFSFFSPIIIATSILSLSFYYQNFNGLIYLCFLLGVCILRQMCYSLTKSSPDDISNQTICTKILYSKYKNSTFSTFVFAFTIMYLSIPMFINNSVNFSLFSTLLIYFFYDIFIKWYKKCIVNTGDLLLNLLGGLVSSILIVSLMYLGGSSKYLFFNEIQSNKEVCTMPSKQTFKCQVYKNGELVGNL